MSDQARAEAYRQAYQLGYRGAGPSQYEPREKPSPEQMKAEFQKQLPEGAQITYIVETSPGKYEVSYRMEGEQPQQPQPHTQTKVIAPNMTPGLKEALFGIVETITTAPTAAELTKSMWEDKAGRAQPITTEEVFMGAVAVASVVAPIAQRKFWPTPQQSYYSAMGKMSKKLYGETALEKAGLKQGTSGEMWMNVQQPYETLRTQPREQFYRVSHGTPTTPMSKTLEATIYGTAKGGLSAEQILVPRSEWVTPPALKGLAMQPKIAPVSGSFPLVFNLSALRQSQQEATSQILGLSQAQTQQQIQTQAQTQVQTQALRQIHFQPGREPFQPRTGSPSLRRLEDPVDLLLGGGSSRLKRIRKQYAIPEPKQVLRFGFSYANPFRNKKGRGRRLVY